MHLRLQSAVLVASLASACGPSARPQGGSRQPPRFVLVSAGTILHIRADEGAPGLTLPVPSPFRRVRTHGDWTEIETVLSPASHCTAAFVPPEGIVLRFHVRGQSFERVLARPFSLTGPRGTLALQPGIPVPRDGNHLIVYEGLRISLVLEPAFAYDYLEPHAERSIQRAERLAPETRARLPDGASVEVGRDTRVFVFNRRPQGEGSRVSVVTRCARIEAVVPDRAVLPNLDLVFDESTTERAATRWTLRSGARLRWSDGSPAGRVTAETAMPGEGHGLVGDRCFNLVLRLAGVAEAPPLQVDVCASERDVRPAR